MQTLLFGSRFPTAKSDDSEKKDFKLNINKEKSGEF